MIAVDNSEYASDSRLPDIPGAQSSDILEKLTGADILVSPLNMPVIEVLLPRHIKAGALLIQRKSGADLPASVGSRLWTSLARMRATGARQWQCCLLPTGFYLPNTKTGKVLIVTPNFHKDGRVTFRTENFPHMDYKSVQSSLRHFCWYGGVVHQLTCDDEIPGWCKVAEKRLMEKCKSGKTKEIWPDAEKLFDPPAKDDPLQEPVEVRDWRRILAQFDKVGPVRVTALRDAMLEHHTDNTLFQALCLASWSQREYLPKIKHWGKGTVQKVRDTLGVPDGFDITLEVAGGSE